MYRHVLSQNSVLALDDSALDSDQVENLIKFCPTKEEIELLKVSTCFETMYISLVYICTSNISRHIVICDYGLFFQNYNGDKENLGKCEQVMLLSSPGNNHKLPLVFMMKSEILD